MIIVSFVRWWQEGRPLVSRWTHDDEQQLTWVGSAANRYHQATRWVRWSWWSYIFMARDSGNTTARPVVWWCRLRGHPAGRVHWNPGGLEPDNRCRNCGEEI
jgi:hypothetical protein